MDPLVNYMGMLRDFHEKYLHEWHVRPTVAGHGTKRLRLALMKEELKEVKEAMESEDLQKIGKELADLLYVTFGTAVAYGLPMNSIFNAVHKSNMTKSRDKSNIGKTIKGPGYEPPDLEKFFLSK